MANRTWSQAQLENAVKQSQCMTDVMRILCLTSTGNSRKIVKKYIDLWKIDASHFVNGTKLTGRRSANTRKIPLQEVLVKGSHFPRTHLKKRLFDEGLKKRECEDCGQGENWRGKKMSLILDHINGDSEDHRIENLRILCPNCNATLPTHCRGNKKKNLSLPENAAA